jgi:apolipoprotein N-acyltransferase
MKANQIARLAEIIGVALFLSFLFIAIVCGVFYSYIFSMWAWIVWTLLIAASICVYVYFDEESKDIPVNHAHGTYARVL